MAALRMQAITACTSARFWFSAFCAVLLPTSIGYQDLSALIKHRPGAASRRDPMIVSPFGSVEAAAFNWRPVGTAMPGPPGYLTAKFDRRTLDGAELLDQTAAAKADYPAVNRALKGNRLASPQPAAAAPDTLPKLQRTDAALSAAPAKAAPAAEPEPHSDGASLDAPPSSPSTPQTADAAPLPEQAAPDEADERAATADNSDAPAAPAATGADDSASPTKPAIAAAVEERTTAKVAPAAPSPSKPVVVAAAEEAAPAKAEPSTPALAFIEDDPAQRATQIFFGGSALGISSALQPWDHGNEPVLVSASVEENVKFSPLAGDLGGGGLGGETIAGKDGVTRVRTPAERLGLEGKARVRAEKCLTDAVYFEARSEPLKGQEAVAQVVMNRVFSGYYPHDVCGVVYQNANRHLACQFTFACEGKNLNRIDEPDLWEQAKRIAKDTLDGKIWLSEVAYATHYHTFWVRPNWIYEMKKMYRLGAHLFYRPRAWGDGGDGPSWAEPTDPAAPDKPSASKVEPAKDEPTAKL